MININEHVQKELLNEYGGSGRKKTVIMDDGHKYMLKFPTLIKGKGREIIYANNSISEYISCKIFESIGIPVQKTMLGEFVDDHGRKEIVCACRDVREAGEQMYEIDKLELNILDSAYTKGLSFAHMEDIFRGMSHIVPEDTLRASYFDMFVVDALIGNPNRSNGDWAVLEQEGRIRISPVYGCGAALAPMVEEKFMNAENGAEYAMRVTSMLRDEHGRRMKYCDILKQKDNASMRAALCRIVPKINLKEIAELICATPYISEQRKEFYRSFVDTTYKKILVPALEKVFGR